jgi:hypothetical protein
MPPLRYTALALTIFLFISMFSWYKLRKSTPSNVKELGFSFNLNSTVFTYYEPVLDNQDEERQKLLNLWRKSWTAYGWTPIVFDSNIAKKHPEYEQYYRAFYSFPTVNPKAYEVACFVRWVCMLVVGGGYLSDMDVMNYGFTPDDAAKMTNGSFHVFQSAVPAFTHGSNAEYERIVKMFAYYSEPFDVEYDKPHTSDMHMLIRFARAGKIKTSIILFEPNVQESKLVHYSTSLTQTHKRAEVILKMRKDPRWNKE